MMMELIWSVSIYAMRTSSLSKENTGKVKEKKRTQLYMILVLESPPSANSRKQNGELPPPIAVAVARLDK